MTTRKNRVTFFLTALCLAAGAARLGALSLDASTKGLAVDFFARPDKGFALGLGIDGGWYEADRFSSISVEADLRLRWLAPRWRDFRLGLLSAPHFGLMSYAAAGDYSYLGLFSELDFGIKALVLEPEFFLGERLSIFASVDLLDAGIRIDLDQSGIYLRALSGRTPSSGPSAIGLGLRYYP